MNKIIFSDITLKYHTHLIFDKFNFSMARHSFTALLGASGVGKTTLLRLLAGLEKPDSGTIMPNISHDIAWMGQRDLLLPWNSVFENVILGKRLRREVIDTSKLREQVQSLLKKVGLPNCLDQKPAQLSIGMRQRVALARTLFEEKDIILMDEPFASVDVVTKRELQELTAELLREKTVLMVTHDPQDALALADSICVLSGRPVALSAVIELSGVTPRTMNHDELWQLHHLLFEKIKRVESN